MVQWTISSDERRELRRAASLPPVIGIAIPAITRRAIHAPFRLPVAWRRAVRPVAAIIARAHVGVTPAPRRGRRRFLLAGIGGRHVVSLVIAHRIVVRLDGGG